MRDFLSDVLTATISAAIILALTFVVGSIVGCQPPGGGRRRPPSVPAATSAQPVMKFQLPEPGYCGWYTTRDADGLGYYATLVCVSLTNDIEIHGQ
jgi:hypothetical protein